MNDFAISPHLARPLAALAGAAMVLLGGCKPPPAPVAEAPAPRNVDIVQVEPRDLPVEFEFVGRTASSQRVEIRARVTGFLDEIAYAEGTFVEEGDVMFRIDPAPFEARLRAANAELAQQQARLVNAQTLLDRIRPLAEADAVARKELDDAEGRVNEAAAAVEGASARVYEAELELGYTTISAPVAGLTGEADQRQGAYISGFSAPLTYVARIDPIWVEFSVSETQVLRGARSSTDGVVTYPEDGNFDVAIVLADGSEHPETGRLTFRDASISERTGTFLIRADLPNPEETLRPGQYVRVFLRGASRPGAIAVPKRAVNEGPKGAFVWVVDRSGLAEQRPVVTGPWIGDSWVIEEGLRDGDRVVVDGGLGLQPGTPLAIVSIVREDPAVAGRRSAAADTPVAPAVDAAG